MVRNLTAENSQNFVKIVCFEHVTSSPRFAQSNGRVERAVETAKMLFSKAYADGKDPYLALLSYRNTPRDNLVGSPAQRLMGRRTKTLLPTTEALLKLTPVNPLPLAAVGSSSFH